MEPITLVINGLKFEMMSNDPEEAQSIGRQLQQLLDSFGEENNNIIEKKRIYWVALKLLAENKELKDKMSSVVNKKPENLSRSSRKFSEISRLAEAEPEDFGQNLKDLVNRIETIVKKLENS